MNDAILRDISDLARPPREILGLAINNVDLGLRALRYGRCPGMDGFDHLKVCPPLPVPAAAQSTWRKGPKSLGKFAVFNTWIPALCSPLNGVTVFGQPAFAASAGELNHSPK